MTEDEIREFGKTTFPSVTELGIGKFAVAYPGSPKIIICSLEGSKYKKEYLLLKEVNANDFGSDEIELTDDKESIIIKGIYAKNETTAIVHFLKLVGNKIKNLIH